MRNIQTGFSIVTAIFLLVVLAFLGTAMVTFSTSQHQAATLDVMGARAYQAARSGLEWGVHQVSIPVAPACVASTTLPAMAGTLAEFTVVVTCVSSAYIESGVAVTVYNLTSTATRGLAGSSDFIERRVEVTITR